MLAMANKWYSYKCILRMLYHFWFWMFLQKISQNIDILARIHGNMFPWQPTLMGNKASYYKSMVQTSLPWHHSSFHNACPCHLKSRQDLRYYLGKSLRSPLNSCNTLLAIMVGKISEIREVFHLGSIPFLWLKAFRNESDLKMTIFFENAQKSEVNLFWWVF